MLKKRLLIAVILAVAVFAVLSLLPIYHAPTPTAAPQVTKPLAAAPPTPVMAPAPHAAAPPAAESHHAAKHSSEHVLTRPPAAGASPPIPAPVGAEPPPPPAPPPLAAPSPAAPPPAGAPDFGQLVQGHAVWQGPKQMTDGDTTPVAISVGSTSVAAAALQQSLQNTVGSQQGVQGGESSADVSARMTATLFGTGFTVTPPGPQEQIVSPTEPTTWSWQVTADAPGQKFLTVVLAAELGGGVRQTTLTEPIAVQVKAKTTLDEMNGAIAYLTAIKTIISLLVAIGGFIFAKPVLHAVENFWSSRKAKKDLPH